MDNLLKKVKTTFSASLGGRTWRAMEYFDPSWRKRIAEMAKYVPAGKSVLDLGCGKMWLQQYIPESAYYPVDYRNREKETIICDFNQRQFPDQKADVAFVSGLIEYLNDVNWLVSRIAEHCDQCVISYCLSEEYPDTAFRSKQAWVNNYSRDEIVHMFAGVGFRLAGESGAIPNNRIFNFVKEAK